MFENRLKIILLLLTFALAIIVARLFDMQVIHGEAYQLEAEEALLLPTKVIPAVRGRILDRSGEELASEEPCWDVQVHYGVLALDPASVTAWTRRLSRQDHYGKGLTAGEVTERFLDDVAAMWRDLALFGDVPEDKLRSEGEDIVSRIQAIHRLVSEHRGFDTPVREERMHHSILTGLDDQRQVAARAVFARYPWVTVEDSTHRVYHAGPAFGHILGRMGPVTAQVLENDPFAATDGNAASPAADMPDEDRRIYLATERLGVTGVERSAERLIRGYRGLFQQNREGVILINEPPVKGQDIHLTVRHDLQEALYALFGRRIASLPFSVGGAVVVLEIPTRECLALVSYPGFEPAPTGTRYLELLADTRRVPLRFRAVANTYAPGSIMKPLTCLAGLDTGEIGLDTQITCRGALFPSNPTAWRCWPDRAGNRMHHGPLTAWEAIKHSCNVFMYTVGEAVGVNRLTGYYDMFGLGKSSGLDLIEEARGINPTPSYLEERGLVATGGMARNYGIGQGELSVTPVQAANLMAEYASGEYRFVSLIRERRDERAWTLPCAAAHWQAIRRGLYGVVNDADGTAHRTAYLDPKFGYALCGKTGSAETLPWVISYQVLYGESADEERTAIIPASTRREAIEAFTREYPGRAFADADVTVHERWPDRPPEHGRRHSHAWFAGYLQPLDASGQPAWNRPPRIAFAVLVEFGGSGGRVAAPIGQAVAETIVRTLGPGLDPDAPPAAEPAEGDAEFGDGLRLDDFSDWGQNTAGGDE